MYNRLNDHEEKGRARAWLYSICMLTVHGHRRKAKRWRASRSLTAHTVPAQPQEPVDRAALALGWKLLHQLPQEQREVFVLCEVKDMSCPRWPKPSTARCRPRTAVWRVRQHPSLTRPR